MQRNYKSDRNNYDKNKYDKNKYDKNKYDKNKEDKNKEEIKSKIFLSFENQDGKELKTFNLSQEVFENILQRFIEEVPNFKSRSLKNEYKIYIHKNIYFKIFNNGSCFVYTVKDTKLSKMNIPLENIYFYLTVTKTNQIMSDEFPGLKNYNYETLFEEIILTINDNVNLIFSKSEKNDYAIYFEKTLSSFNENFELSEMTEIINLLSKTS